ncbi:MAG: hypothetical protein GXO64_04055 [Candidatus Micrarchaeota archaeon]|nr:hypothetical protein [Candidatus Micrarchaeota archaeon]
MGLRDLFRGNSILYDQALNGNVTPSQYKDLADMAQKIAYETGRLPADVARDVADTVSENYKK